MTWGRAFPYQRRESEPLEAKCERIKAELAECRRLAEHPQSTIDFIEPRRDDQ